MSAFASYRVRRTKLQCMTDGRRPDQITPHHFQTTAFTVLGYVSAYTLIAFVYLVYPIADRFGKVLLGTAVFQPDAVLTAAIIEWGYKSLQSPALHVWEWVAGFPMHNSLAITENLRDAV